MADLGFLNTLPEEDRYYIITQPSDTVGTKHDILIPEGKIFVIISATIATAVPATSTSQCHANLKFDGIVFDRLYYDYTQDSTTKPRDSTSGHFLVGDGERKITLEIDSISGVEAQFILLGYYKDRISNIGVSRAVQNLVATELSADDIRLDWDEPLDNGGSPIIKYRIRRGTEIGATGNVSNFVTLIELDNVNRNLKTYHDGNLLDNVRYYYEVIPITLIDDVETEGVPSEVVSARTDIDHPGPPTNLRITPLSSTRILLAWTSPVDTGGTPIGGYQIQRSRFPTSGFVDVVSNTRSTTTFHTDFGLVGHIRYYYRIKAINTGNLSSLVFSNTASIVTSFTAPTNLRSIISSDSRTVALFWDAPTDTSNIPITGYLIERSLDNVNFVTIAQSTGSARTFYDDTSIDGGRDYYYRVTAHVRNTVDTAASPSHKVIIPAHPPSAPRTLRSQVLNFSQIKLTWRPPASSGGSHITGYKLQRSKSVGFPDGSGNAQVHEEQNTGIGKPIQGNTVTEDVITVAQSDAFIIDTIEVSVNITHPWRGDMDIVLESPTGKVVTIKPADLDDRADNVIGVYRGDLFNAYIGDSSEGAWKLKIRDIHELSDNGTLNSWGIRFIKATEPIMEFDLGTDLQYTDSGLDGDSRYFYRVRAVSDIGISPFSPIANARTPSSIFGHSNVDLVVPSFGRVRLSNRTVYEYRNIIVLNNGVLECSDTIIRCSGTYTEHDGGRIEVTKTGCEGGIGGTTMGGEALNSLRITRFDITNPRPDGSPRPATMTPHTLAENCTSQSTINGLVAEAEHVDVFNTFFRNRVGGSKGSDGTPAALSGASGESKPTGTGDPGQSDFIAGGGDGGTAAQGVDGVRGGGKFAFFAKMISDTLTISAKGNDGIDGNQGTGEAGGMGDTITRGRRSVTATGTDGEDASPDGTMGSAGSTGGIVYVLYENLQTAIRIDDTFDSTLEGFVQTKQDTTNATLTVEDGMMVQRVTGASQVTRISKTYDLAGRGNNETILSFDWRYLGNTNLGGANRFFILLKDVDTDEELYRFRLGSPNVSDSGFQTKSIDITTILGARTSVKLEFETPPYLRTDIEVTRYFDNFIFEYREDGDDPAVSDIIRLDDTGVDVTGGVGGFHGADAGATNPLINTRASTGPDGVKILARLSDLFI